MEGVEGRITFFYDQNFYLKTQLLTGLIKHTAIVRAVVAD